MYRYFKNIATAAPLTEVRFITQMELPKVIHGRMYVLGGQIGEIHLNVSGNTEEEKYRSAALTLARLSNKFMETEILLDLNSAQIARLQYLLNRQADISTRIGFRSSEIKLFPSSHSGMTSPDRIHQRPIHRNILGQRITVALAFGATNFRFELIEDGKVLTKKTIPAQFYDLRTQDISAIIEEKDFLTRRDAELFREILTIINKGRKKGNEPSLKPEQRRLLREIQTYRIIKTINELLSAQNIEKRDLRGIAFTSAGIINMETGVVMAENIPGFEDVIGGINITEALESIYARPVISLNDVDSEIAALMRVLQIAYEFVLQGMPRERIDEILRYKQFLRTAESINQLAPGEKLIITGYGGGTGIGGVQISVEKLTGGKLRINILTGRYQSAGEHGHDLMDSAIPEVKMAVDAAVSQGIPRGFIDSAIDYIKRDTCIWCGNNFDLERAASGVTGIILGRFLLERYTGVYAEAFRGIIAQNHPDKLQGVSEDDSEKALSDAVDARDIIEMYKAYDNPEAKYILRLMAKFWAAHMIMTYKDGKQLFIDGKQQNWTTFFVTHGMFRPGNEFFRDCVLESLAHDFTDEHGRTFDYTNIFTLVFQYDDDNQALGADEVLKAEIDRQLNQ